MCNLATCELDKRRHLVTDVRTSKDTCRHLPVWPPGVASRRCDVTASVLCQHQSSGICFNYVLCPRSHCHSCSCCFVDSTCHQPVMAASRLQELAAMRNLTTCELDKSRHLVADVRTSKRHMASSTCLATKCRSYLTHIPYTFFPYDLFMPTHSLHS